MQDSVDFHESARLPSAGDNVAIATRCLQAGTRVNRDGQTLRLPHTVLEGHRFVLTPMSSGEPLLSWGLAFGIATRRLEPGEYVCNQKILTALADRQIDFELPESANFRDHIEPYVLDPERFEPGTQVARVDAPATFPGYRRPAGRGVGTRNFIVILATTSRTAVFAEQLAERFEDVARGRPNIDGVVAVTHTEGGGNRQPNNLEFVLRTLAGMMVHPNVGAVLAVDDGGGAFGNKSLRNFMMTNGYELEHVRHEFMTLDAARAVELERAAAMVSGWLTEVNAIERTRESVSHLRLALQCGGSDAFSGISGNALAGWVAKQVIRNGGSANLAETDELIGAEAYVLENVRDESVAQAFLDKITTFKNRAAHHGATAEGNPSGGNNYRGLYNIALKSIGAARKRDPEVRLDHVINYAEPMTGGGFYFMDSPGNDLESIAGQVAAGANLILFITGNGSITNFPFVPTLKFVTTTRRFELLAAEMDVNAGRYNDGEPMDDLGAETFDLALRVAGGELSKGELAGHSQVSIWRDWRQNDAAQVEAIRAAPAPRGNPLTITSDAPVDLEFEAFVTAKGHAGDQIGLIMPTSLCSGQVAKLAAADLNQLEMPGVTRFVALAHTEGCGSANADHHFLQTLLGHVTHPCVRRAMLLEHGCERTHNDAVRLYLEKQGMNVQHLGFASVQLDGGLDKVRHKIINWFQDSLGRAPGLETQTVGTSSLRLGLTTLGSVPSGVGGVLAKLMQGVVSAGGTVVIAANASVLVTQEFIQTLFGHEQWRETLAYGEAPRLPGCHVMEAPTDDAIETLTGLGGTGVDLLLALVDRAPLPSHPIVPLLQAAGKATAERFAGDVDVVLNDDEPSPVLIEHLTRRITETMSRRYAPKLHHQGHTQFQLTRGLLGLSL